MRGRKRRKVYPWKYILLWIFCVVFQSAIFCSRICCKKRNLQAALAVTVVSFVTVYVWSSHSAASQSASILDELNKADHVMTSGLASWRSQQLKHSTTKHHRVSDPNIIPSTRNGAETMDKMDKSPEVLDSMLHRTSTPEPNAGKQIADAKVTVRMPIDVPTTVPVKMPIGPGDIRSNHIIGAMGSDTRSADGALSDVRSADGALSDVRSADGALSDVRSAVNGALSDVRSADGALSDTRSADGALSDVRSADGALSDTRSADGALSDTRSPDGALSDTRSADGALSDTRSPDGALSVDANVPIKVPLQVQVKLPVDADRIRNNHIIWAMGSDARSADGTLADASSDARVPIKATSKVPVKFPADQVGDRNGHNIEVLGSDARSAVNGALSDTRSADGALSDVRSADGALSDTRSADGAMASDTVAPARPVKVIVSTYMRSGSTLTGELFARDVDNTFYLFEPEDGMYSELYGMFTGMYPPDIFFYTDKTKRDIPDFERDFITTTTLQILSCNFTGLSANVLSQRFLLERDFPATRPFIQCLHSRYPKAPVAQTCQGKIQNFCPQFFDRQNKRHEVCHRHLHGDQVEELSRVPQFQAHEECTKRADERARECVELLTEQCQKRRVRSMKTIRLSLELADTMLRRDADVKLLHLVRDPRGIIYSRSQRDQARLLSRLSRGDILTEAAALCEHMMQDDVAFQSLRAVFPQRVTRVRYEDLAEDPVGVGREIYRFTQGIAMPEPVRRFITQRTHAREDGDTFNTNRANATATAHKWQILLPERTRATMNVLCRDIIERLGYPL